MIVGIVVMSAAAVRDGNPAHGRVHYVGHARQSHRLTGFPPRRRIPVHLSAAGRPGAGGQAISGRLCDVRLYTQSCKGVLSLRRCNFARMRMSNSMALSRSGNPGGLRTENLRLVRRRKVENNRQRRRQSSQRAEQSQSCRGPRHPLPERQRLGRCEYGADA